MTDPCPTHSGRRRRLAVAGFAIAVLGLTACSGGARAEGPIAPPAGAVTQVPVTSTNAPGARSWAPWPQAQHDARHSGASTTAGPTHGTVAWKRDLGGSPMPGGPVIGTKDAYLTDASGTLHAIDLADGHDVWTADTGAGVAGDLSVAPLILPGGDVVTGTATGLAAWAAADGHMVWSVDLDGGSWTSPASVDGTRVYVGSRNGVVAAVDVSGATATLGWRLDTGVGSSYGSVVTTGDGRVYTTSGSGLVAVDDLGTSGRLAWTREPHDNIVEVSPGLSPDGIVLLGTNGRSEWAYDRSGAMLWQAPRGISYSSPSVTDDGLAYVAEHANVVHVYDVHDGSEVGRYSTAVEATSNEAQVWTSVVVDRAHDLYFGTRLGYVVGVRPDGSRLFTVDIGTSTSSYPALTADGHLLIATDDGTLLSIG